MVHYLGIASARISFRLRGGSADISNDDKVFMDSDFDPSGNFEWNQSVRFRSHLYQIRSQIEMKIFQSA